MFRGSAPPGPGSAFETIAAVLIITNAIFIGVEAGESGYVRNFSRSRYRQRAKKGLRLPKPEEFVGVLARPEPGF